MLGDASGLTKATRKGSKDLGALGNASKKLNGILKGAFVGFSIAGVTSQLFDFAKAASEDVQGSRLLAQSLANNVKGGEKFSGQVEDLISKLSVMAAVTDDEIRPAFGYLVRATKSVGKSSKLMSVALDLAAGSGVSVQAAASALGRAYNGNLTALNKLVPGIKKLKNPLGEVEKRFKGMAKIQGENDPFLQMTILADEAKEEIGKALLPEIKKFAKYLQSEKGNKLITDVVASIKELVRQGIKLGKWVVDNKQTLLVFGGLLAGLKVTSAAINGYKTLLTVWQGLAKASKLIKAPATGGDFIGPLKPGAKKNPKIDPTLVGGKVPKLPKLLKVGGILGTAAAILSIPSSSTGDTPEARKKRISDRDAYLKTTTAPGAGKGTYLRPIGANVTKPNDGNLKIGGTSITYKVVIENNNNTKITGREIVAEIKAEARRRGLTSGVWNLGQL